MAHKVQLFCGIAWDPFQDNDFSVWATETLKKLDIETQPFENKKVERGELEDIDDEFGGGDKLDQLIMHYQTYLPDGPWFIRGDEHIKFGRVIDLEVPTPNGMEVFENDEDRPIYVEIFDET